MFAQNGQLSEAFGRDRYERRGRILPAALLPAARWPGRQADHAGARHVKHPLSGKEQPLATEADRMDSAYGDKIIVTTRAETPMALAKKCAWQTDKPKFLPPPSVKRGTIGRHGIILLHS